MFAPLAVNVAPDPEQIVPGAVEVIETVGVVETVILTMAEPVQLPFIPVAV